MHFKSIFTTSFFTVITYLLVFFGPINYASAFDTKAYSGSVCQAYFGQDEVWFYKYNSGIYNRSSAYRWISCAFAKDRQGSVGTRSAWVFVVAPSSGRTSCYLSERNFNGAAVSTRAGSRFGTGWISIDTSSSINSYYVARHMYCFVPPGARVATIEVSEW